LIFKNFTLIIFLIFLGCEQLPTENKTYEKKPVVFGYIDAGLSKIDTLYLSWSNDFSTSHYDIEYIEDATVTLTTIGNTPEYDNSNSLILQHFENGKYLIDTYPSNFNITPGATWNLNISFTDYTLTSSTIIPDKINLSTLTDDITYNDCFNQPVSISTINLYQDQNQSLIDAWINSRYTNSVYESIDLNWISYDSFTYKTDECYTSSFADIPFFILNLGESTNENVISRYTTISLETDKDMNGDTFNIPYEAAIFDTTISANAFKGPMNYHEIDYENDFPEIDPATIPYEWGWHRNPIDRINLTGIEIPATWLFFDYYGINMMTVEPMGDEYERYFESDPDQFNFPYILREGNVENAYGLFYSTNSSFFFFNVEKEE